MTGLLVRFGFPEGGNKVVVFLIELLVLSAVGIFSVCEKGEEFRGGIYS
jgi:hypothetical protein